MTPRFVVVLLGSNGKSHGGIVYNIFIIVENYPLYFLFSYRLLEFQQTPGLTTGVGVTPLTTPGKRNIREQSAVLLSIHPVCRVP